MGSCFGRCLSDRAQAERSSTEDEPDKNLIHNNRSMNETSFIFRIMKTKEKRHSKFLERFWAHQDMRYSRLNKSTHPPTHHHHHHPYPAIDIPLQNLDAHSLLLSRQDRGYGYLPSCTNSSPASSSLDLEWEHEYNSNNHSWMILPQEITIDEMSSEDDDQDSSSNVSTNPNTSNNNKRFTKLANSARASPNNNGGTTSKISWSHISTPESLEWDINVDHELKSEEDFFDNETMELLQEIEWLKNRALNETGERFREMLESES